MGTGLWTSMGGPFNAKDHRKERDFEPREGEQNGGSTPTEKGYHEKSPKSG